MKKFSKILSICAVLALLIACAVFSVSAEESVVTPPTWDDFAQTGFDSADTPCPHCVEAGAADTTPEWTKYTGSGQEFSSGTTHIYIDTNVNLTARMLASNNATVVVWIKPGVTVTALSSYDAFRANGGHVWILGGTGSIVTGDGDTSTSHAGNGGLMRVLGSGSMHIYGDTTFKLNREDNKVTSEYMGGLVDANNGNLYMHGGSMIGPVDASSGTVRGCVVISGSKGHFYMTGGRLKGSGTGESAPINVASTGTVEISGNAYIEGYSGTATSSAGYAIHQKNGAGTTTIKGGTIVGGVIDGTHDQYGSAIYLTNGTMNIYGGTIYGGSSKYGGAIYIGRNSSTTNGTTTTTSTGTMNIGSTDASITTTPTIYGGKLMVTDGKRVGNGGAIYVVYGKLNINKGNIYANTVAGYAANKGGTIYMSSSSTVNINGGTIYGGEAANGGTIYIAAGTLTMTSGTINGGVAKNSGVDSSDGHGATVYMGGGSATFQGGTVNGGKTTRVKNSSDTYNGGDGGAFYVTSSTLNLTGATVNGGTCYRGSVFFVTGSSGKVNMTAGTINSGSASNQGDLAGVYSSGTFNMTGGVAHNSQTGEESGFRVQNGKVYLHGNAKVEAAAGGRNGFDMISTNSTSAVLVLAGNACVSDLDGNQTNVHNITFQSHKPSTTTYYPILRIANDWTGYASITDNFGSTVSGEYIMSVTSGDTTKYYAQCGTWDAENLSFTQGGNYEAGKLIHGGADDGDLPVFGEGGNLMLPRAKAVVNGATSWYRLADQAADAAADGNGYAVLYKDDTNPITIASGKTVCMDFNGFDATVTGEGTLQGTDSSALTTGTGTSAVTFEGVTVKTLANDPVTGDSYIAIKDGNTVSFHAITANITAVSIRPGTVGMYYTAKFVCDDIVKDRLNSFGLALSLAGMPDENFETDSKTLYTMTEGSKLSADGYNSVIVQNIMESQLTTETNKNQGEMPIYANAYMKLTVDGEEVIVMATNTAEFSLETLLERVNTYWDTFPEAAQTSLATKIYDSYIRSFEDNSWNVYNLRIKANGGYTAEEEAILEERRQTVMDYMRESISLLWRSDKTFTYSLGNTERDQGKSFTIVEGRLYRGLPYVYAAGTQDSFLEYADGEPDENGIYTITGLEATALNYESYGGRVGNDCSGAVTNAWSQVSTTVAASTSSGCSPYFGVVPVGNYLFNAPINPSTNRVLDTKVVVETNGQQTMFEAYAMLQPADAAYHQEYPSTKGNHIRMVSRVHVERNKDGTIDGANSYIIMLEQTRNLTSNNTTTTHPVTGETIYVIGGIDRKYTFNSLFNDHYIPVTVAELRDPTPVEETWVADSLEEPASIENLFTGNISSNRYTDAVKITIYNENGEVVQESISRKSRSYSKLFRMSQFVNEKPGSFKGQLDLEALEAGNYRCTVTLKLTIDDDYIHTVRDFTFSK